MERCTKKEQLQVALSLLNRSNEILTEAISGEDGAEDIFCPLGEVISNVEGWEDE
jgi:hypothetical protein